MKQSFLIIFFAIFFIGIAGCSDEHVISTDEGHMIDSQSKPEVDEDTGMIKYEDEDGRENQVPVDDVKEIKER